MTRIIGFMLGATFVGALALSFVADSIQYIEDCKASSSTQKPAHPKR